MKKRTRCAGPDGPYCGLLDQRLEAFANASRKGLVLVQFSRFTDDGVTTRNVGIAHKEGPRDGGLMLNFCPWCGADIRPKEAPPRATPTQSNETRRRADRA